MTERRFRNVTVCCTAALVVCCVLSAGCLQPPLEIGSAQPALRAAGWTNGDAPSLQDLEGKVVVLDVFATW